jgi:hypothetical protein
VTATTLGARPTGPTGRGGSGGDAQERAATNPVAVLPCARTPLLIPLSIPLLIPPSATVGADAPDFLLFGRGLGGSTSSGGPRNQVGRWRVRGWSAPH